LDFSPGDQNDIQRRDRQSRRVTTPGISARLCWAFQVSSRGQAGGTLEAGEPLSEFLEDFPTVSREQAVAALDQAKDALLARAHSA
jgi:hypothetical protein